MRYMRTLLFLIMFSLVSSAAKLPAEIPLLGAQIWIEPGQTPSEIDAWFGQLQAAHMPVARLFIMWSYLQPSQSRWDFSLYDAAFRSAEMHHVQIVATLTPSGLPLFLGGDGTQGQGLVKTTEQQAASDEYIKRVVRRYRSSPAMNSWILLNEPGQAPSASPLATEEFRRWLRGYYPSVAAMNLAWGTNYADFEAIKADNSVNSWNATPTIDWMTFWRKFQTDQLHRTSEIVRREDPKHGIHLNPHALLSNLAGLSDDLPEWRGFLDTLGCSIHPAWHFGLLGRDQYALGVSYINDLVAGSIEPRPHWVTELQGGNNISSGLRPMNPTSADIAQWVWTSIGAGANRVIFWLLNARREGVEAAEWSLLDFQQKPSVRLETAAKIAQTIHQNAGLFAAAKPEQPPVTLIVSLGTMTYEAAFAKADYPGRDRNAQMLETLGIYQALTRLGPPPAIKHFDDYNWETTSERPRVVVLPDIRILSTAQITRLKSFVDHGNTLLITGLTGLYDPHGKAWPLAGFPLREVTGGTLKEVNFIGDLFSEKLTTPEILLPSHLWSSSINTTDAEGIGTRNGEVIATDRETHAHGRVIWIPSPIGLGAWLQTPEPLAQYMKKLLAQNYEPLPFQFRETQHSCLMRVLRSDSGYVTVVTNGAEAPTHCTLEHVRDIQPKALWGSTPMTHENMTELTLQPEETSVMQWR
jgi:beta-galactosidase